MEGTRKRKRPGRQAELREARKKRERDQLVRLEQESKEERRMIRDGFDRMDRGGIDRAR